MYRPFRNFALPLSLLLATACGGDDNKSADAGDNTTPDAAVGGGICDPVTVLSAYPANFSGDVLGAGADLNVASGICDDERSHFTQAGEDQVVQLDGLTPGANYVVRLQADSDLAFYVATDCTDAELVAGQCLLFADEQLGQTDEVADFTAPASGSVLVIVDHFATEAPLTDGSYTLSVLEPECTENVDCDGTPDTPFCSDFECVACANSFQCDTAGAPVCDGTTNTCVAGSDTCTPDDATESGDDGPAGAAVLAAPVLNTPTVVNANICSDPLTEIDFYTIDLAQDASVVFSLEWDGATDGPDLDLVLLNEAGQVLDSSFSDNPEVIIASGVDAGTYFLAVSKFEQDGAPVAASVAYTLTASVPECESSFDCLLAVSPVCGPALSCIAGGDACTGDDAGEENDGPAAATPILGNGTVIDANICNTPSIERDFYQIAVTNGQNLAVSLAYTEDGAADVDVSVFNAAGDLMGFTFWQNPETVDLTFLPAGIYFIEVRYFGAAVTVAHPYSISATTSAGACTSSADCAAVFGTQLYRGSCDTGTGACSAIEGNDALALDAACDSPDDCTSGVCSYMTFQESADLSVCTVNCNATSECTTAHGAGFSCTVPFTNNFCHPDCAGNLECGANPNSETLDTDQPWDYLLCNAGACELDN